VAVTQEDADTVPHQMNFEFLKPGEEEIRALALREADPRYAAEFVPVCRGPVAAVLLLVWAGLCSVPRIVLTSLRQLTRGKR
jgi:hypothetical protein